MAKICYSFVPNCQWRGRRVAGWIKCTWGKIINDLEGFFPKICSLTPPTIKRKRERSVIIVCTPFCSGGGVWWWVEPSTKFSKRKGVWQDLSLLFSTKLPEIPGTHFINAGRMKGWVDLAATHWYWTWNPWIRNPAPWPLGYCFIGEF